VHVPAPAIHHALQTLHGCTDPKYLADLSEVLRAVLGDRPALKKQQAGAIRSALPLVQALLGPCQAGLWGGACVVLRQLLAGNPCKGELVEQMAPLVPLLLGIALDGEAAGGQEGWAGDGGAGTLPDAAAGGGSRAEDQQHQRQQQQQQGHPARQQAGGEAGKGSSRAQPMDISFLERLSPLREEQQREDAGASTGAARPPPAHSPGAAASMHSAAAAAQAATATAAVQEPAAQPAAPLSALRALTCMMEACPGMAARASQVCSAACCQQLLGLLQSEEDEVAGEAAVLLCLLQEGRQEVQQEVARAAKKIRLGPGAG
jgi:hypothetical protein